MADDDAKPKPRARRGGFSSAMLGPASAAKTDVSTTATSSLPDAAAPEGDSAVDLAAAASTDMGHSLTDCAQDSLAPEGDAEVSPAVAGPTDVSHSLTHCAQDAVDHKGESAEDPNASAKEEAKRLAAEEEKRKAAEEEEAGRKAADEEDARRQAAEEEAKRLAAEEEERKAVEEEEAGRKAAAEEDARRQAAEEEAKRLAAEEEERKAAEEEARRKVAAENARRQAADEEEATRLAAEEEERKATEEEAIRKAAEEDARRQASEEEAKRLAADEEEERKAAEDEARRKAAAEDAKRQVAEEETNKLAAEEEERKAAEEEAMRKAAEEHARRQAAEAEAKRLAAEEEERKAAEEEEVQPAQQTLLQPAVHPVAATPTDVNDSPTDCVPDVEAPKGDVQADAMAATDKAAVEASEVEIATKHEAVEAEAELSPEQVADAESLAQATQKGHSFAEKEEGADDDSDEEAKFSSVTRTDQDRQAVPEGSDPSLETSPNAVEDSWSWQQSEAWATQDWKDGHWQQEGHELPQQAEWNKQDWHDGDPRGEGGHEWPEQAGWKEQDDELRETHEKLQDQLKEMNGHDWQCSSAADGTNTWSAAENAQEAGLCQTEQDSKQTSDLRAEAPEFIQAEFQTLSVGIDAESESALVSLREGVANPKGGFSQLIKAGHAWANYINMEAQNLQVTALVGEDGPSDCDEQLQELLVELQADFASSKKCCEEVCGGPIVVASALQEDVPHLSATEALPSLASSSDTKHEAATPWEGMTATVLEDEKAKPKAAQAQAWNTWQGGAEQQEVSWQGGTEQWDAWKGSIAQWDEQAWDKDEASQRWEKASGDKHWKKDHETSWEVSHDDSVSPSWEQDHGKWSEETKHSKWNDESTWDLASQEYSVDDLNSEAQGALQALPDKDVQKLLTALNNKAKSGELRNASGWIRKAAENILAEIQNDQSGDWGDVWQNDSKDDWKTESWKQSEEGLNQNRDTEIQNDQSGDWGDFWQNDNKDDWKTKSWKQSEEGQHVTDSPDGVYVDAWDTSSRYCFAFKGSVVTVRCPKGTFDACNGTVQGQTVELWGMTGSLQADGIVWDNDCLWKKEKEAKSSEQNEIASWGQIGRGETNSWNSRPKKSKQPADRNGTEGGDSARNWRAGGEDDMWGSWQKEAGKKDWNESRQGEDDLWGSWQKESEKTNWNESGSSATNGRSAGSKDDRSAGRQEKRGNGTDAWAHWNDTSNHESTEDPFLTNDPWSSCRKQNDKNSGAQDHWGSSSWQKNEWQR